MLPRRLIHIVVPVVTALALTGATPAFAADSDHDGLPNRWEAKTAPHKLNIRKLGAKPKHKDVFVELNYSHATGPGEVQCSGLNDLVAAFKRAPLDNPDGKDGISLHIDAGKNCGAKDYDFGGSSEFGLAGPCVTPTDWGNALAAKRLKVFHLGAVVANTQLCTAEGQATETDFDVKVNDGDRFFAYVFMHELGHIFGLDHGAFNSFSVMSGGAFEYGDNSGRSYLDYTRYPIEALDESDLDEQTGYETGSTEGDDYLSQFYGPQNCLGDHDQNPMTPDTQALVHVGHAHGEIDFDCQGADFWVPPYSQYIDASPVSYDVDGDGSIGTIPAVEPEWPTVGQGLGNGRIGP